jgi:glycosyltransferase 2 family protein
LLGRLGEVARAVQFRLSLKQIDWKRISWNRVGIALSASIILVAGVALSYRLRGLDWEAVVSAIRAVPLTRVAAAGFFVACGYVTLALYDWFALRTIGARQVPLRVAALAGATSYAIGHGLGAMLFASAAIRLRIYFEWGLGVVDIGKICFIAGLTFWLGNITALGIGMTIMPEAAGAVDQIPSWGNQAIGIAALSALSIYLIWVWGNGRVLGRNGAAVTLPSGSMTLLQIGIGLADLSCCSLVMYLLMPSLPAVDFIPLAVIVVFGTLLGFASHAPGAIGALDAAMLIGLPTFDPSDLIATLLLYRLLYFVAPFALALAGLGLREACVHFRQ